MRPDVAAVLVVVLVGGPALAGCLDAGRHEQRVRRTLSRYRLVLDPVNYTWNASSKVLSGNITLTSLYDGETAPATDLMVWGLDMHVEYRGSSPTDLLQEWDLSFASAQTPRVGPGQTFVANWTVGRGFDENQSVEEIELRVSYGYRAFQNRSGDRYDVGVIYFNPCIRVHGRSLRVQTDQDRCNPDSPKISSYGVSVDSGGETVELPPTEHWERWEGWERRPQFAEPMQPVRAYMQDPSYENVTYFEGEVW